MYTELARRPCDPVDHIYILRWDVVGYPFIQAIYGPVSDALLPALWTEAARNLVLDSLPEPPIDLAWANRQEWRAADTSRSGGSLVDAMRRYAELTR